LTNFLTTYRGFLAEVQANPADIDSLVELHTQRIVESLNAINNEIALRRKKRGYEFMRGLAGDNFFEAAMNCAPWGLLSFLLGPWLQFYAEGRRSSTCCTATPRVTYGRRSTN